MHSRPSRAIPTERREGSKRLPPLSKSRTFHHQTGFVLVGSSQPLFLIIELIQKQVPTVDVQLLHHHTR